MRLARLGTRSLLAAAGVFLAALAACDGGSPLAEDGGARIDAPGAGIDGGSGDAAPPPQDEVAGACFDAIDNDDDLSTDCADMGCAGASCCVGSSDPSCCAETPVDRPIFMLMCDDGAAGDCLDPSVSSALFGSVTPTIERGALVPQGGTGHGGVSLPEPIDPRAQNLELRATIVVPENRCTDCADGAGLGIFGELPDAQSPVLVGAVISGSLGEVLVIVADEIVARVPLETGERTLALRVDVAGTVRVMDDDRTVGEINGVALPERMWSAVFGRTDNRGAGIDAIGVLDAQLSTTRCEVPSALVRRATPVVPWSGTTTWTPQEVRGPSVATYVDATERIFMVYAFEGQIYGARRTGIGEFRSDSGDPGNPLLALPSDIVRASDPSIVAENMRFHLYFTGTDASGVSRIYKALGESDWSETFGVPAVVVEPGPIGATSVDGASVIVGNPSWHMVLRAFDEDGMRIVELTGDDEGLDWGGPRTVREPQGADLFAFDRDEVAAPAMISFADLRGRPLDRLFYAGRRGTRWSIGLLTRDAGGGWRPIGPVLEGSDTGFDALGVTDPAPVVEAGALRFYYAGTDGDGFAIGEAGPAGTVGE